MKAKLKAFAEKWFQFSKLIVLVSGVIFIGTLVICISKDLSSLYDSSMYLGAITVTGGVFGSAIVWYEKKSQAENVAKIQLQHIKDLSEIEFNVYERKVRLQKELHILGQPDIPMDPEGVSHVDEALEAVINRSLTHLDTSMEEATSAPEMQAYG